LHELLLAKLRAADQIDFSRAAVDSSSIRAVGAKTGPNPTDRARPGSKHHIVTDANGTPLAAILTGANVNDVAQLLPLIDAIPPIRGLRGHHCSGRVWSTRIAVTTPSDIGARCAIAVSSQ
jgi:hypothetical protein